MSVQTPTERHLSSSPSSVNLRPKFKLYNKVFLAKWNDSISLSTINKWDKTKPDIFLQVSSLCMEQVKTLTSGFHKIYSGSFNTAVQFMAHKFIMKHVLPMPWFSFPQFSGTDCHLRSYELFWNLQNRSDACSSPCLIPQMMYQGTETVWNMGWFIISLAWSFRFNDFFGEILEHVIQIKMTWRVSIQLTINHFICPKSNISSIFWKRIM